MNTTDYLSSFLETRTLGYAHLHALMDWTVVYTALWVGAMSVIQFVSRRDHPLLMVGIATGVSGIAEAIHALATESFSLVKGPDIHNWLPLTWVLSSCIRPLIESIVVACLVFGSDKRASRILSTGSLVLVVAFEAKILHMVLSMDLPLIDLHIIHTDGLLKRPADLLPIPILLLDLVVLYPQFIQKRATPTSIAMYFALFAQVFAQLSMTFFMTTIGDNAFFVAHILKTLSYIIPAVGISAEYVPAFRAKERAAREQARISDTLRSSEGRKQQILDTAMDSIVVINSQGRVVEWNKACERLFQYSRKEAIGSSMTELIVPPHLRNAHLAGFARYMKTNVPKILGTRVEILAMRKDGFEFPAELTNTVFEEDGEKLFTAYIRDISERKAAEEALHKAKLTSEAASEAKSRFLANMSHELRTPLTAILGYVDLLSTKSVTVDDCIGVVRRNAEVLLNIMSDILDVSKIEMGDMALERSPYDPKAILQEICSKLEPRAREKGLEFRVEFADPVPKMITTDSFRLRQVLHNVIGNAVKFTSHGAVRVTMRWESLPSASDTDGSSSHLMVEISDTGMGINPSQLENLFMPFSQADVSTVRKFGGTGLGLAISRSLCRMLGGDLKVNVSPLGSTFTIVVDADPACVPGYPCPGDVADLGAAAIPTSSDHVCRCLLSTEAPDTVKAFGEGVAASWASVPQSDTLRHMMRPRGRRHGSISYQYPLYPGSGFTSVTGSKESSVGPSSGASGTQSPVPQILPSLAFPSTGTGSLENPILSSSNLIGGAIALDSQKSSGGSTSVSSLSPMMAGTGSLIIPASMRVESPTHRVPSSGAIQVPVTSSLLVDRLSPFSENAPSVPTTATLSNSAPLAPVTVIRPFPSLGAAQHPHGGGSTGVSSEVDTPSLSPFTTPPSVTILPGRGGTISGSISPVPTSQIPSALQTPVFPPPRAPSQQPSTGTSATGSTTGSSHSSFSDLEAIRVKGEILVAEDSPQIQQVLRLRLSMAGATVKTANDGLIAYNIAHARHEEGRPFDLLLLDMSMPEMDGYSVAKKLKAEGYCGRIAALTAHALADDRELCLKAGCDDYASKPIGGLQLLMYARGNIEQFRPCERCVAANQRSFDTRQPALP